MNRLASSVLVATLACALAACKSTTTESSAPKAATRDFEGKEKIRFRDESPQAASGESSGSGSNVGGYILAPFENIVYLPWKFLGSGFKGVSDGIHAGFAKDRMPMLGAIFSPVNALLGFGTGAVEGVAISPGLVGPEDSFSHSMSLPTKHATTIWWYQ